MGLQIHPIHHVAHRIHQDLLHGDHRDHRVRHRDHHDDHRVLHVVHQVHHDGFRDRRAHLRIRLENNIK